jgi:hypothetical protein
MKKRDLIEIKGMDLPVKIKLNYWDGIVKLVKKIFSGHDYYARIQKEPKLKIK